MAETNEPKVKPEVSGVKEFADVAPLPEGVIRPEKPEEAKTVAETVVAEVVEEVVKSCDTCRHYAAK